MLRRCAGVESFSSCCNSPPPLVPPSYPRSYPQEELVLKLADPVGLADADIKALSKQLHQAAASYAQEGEICCFQLVTLVQEFLQV